MYYIVIYCNGVAVHASGTKKSVGGMSTKITNVRPVPTRLGCKKYNLALYKNYTQNIYALGEYGLYLVHSMEWR